MYVIVFSQTFITVFQKIGRAVILHQIGRIDDGYHLSTAQHQTRLCRFHPGNQMLPPRAQNTGTLDQQIIIFAFAG